MSAYQDTWVAGKVAARGYRECADRYAIVKKFCDRYSGRPFTVCDVGANMCYFGIRLTADFSECRVVAFEFDHVEMRRKCLKENKAERIVLLNHRLGLADLEQLAYCCHFDVVLALSVIHHLGGPSDRVVNALRRLGNHLIAEFALSDSPRVAKRVAAASPKSRYRIPRDGTVLGYGKSHLNGAIERPLIHLPGIPWREP